ncbi:MAG: X-Pro dipeptidyl-peptidase, partial [Thermoplasmata archaeon]|nr:X-Pro dipeptidyl-peptidase [Thermoplasmata archaeon]
MAACQRWANVRRPLALAMLCLLTAGCFSGDAPAETAAPAGTPVGGFSHTAVFAGQYEKDETSSSHVLAEGPWPVGGGEVTLLASAVDGVDIEVGVVRPEVPAGTRVPVLAVATPYNSPLTPDGIADQAYPGFIDDFVPHGYAYATISARGTAGSGGCMDLLGPLERADLDQAVTWLGTQEWSDGGVALLGISYDGSTPWQVAATGNPHLKTIVPMEGITDYFQLDYRNGTANSFGWGTELTGYYLLPFGLGVINRPPAKTAEAAQCPAMVETAVAQPFAAAVGTHDPLGFWAARDLRPMVLDNYHGSVFVSQGFLDDNVDPAQVTPLVNQLEARGVAVKQLWGQWYHRFPDRTGEDASDRWDWHETLLHWFDYWLKGDTTVDLGPRAQIQDPFGQWRSEDSWPPADSHPVAFELSADGRLLNGTDAEAGSLPVPMSAPMGGQGSTTGDLWNDAALVCQLCPTFLTEPFAEEFRFAGLPTVHVTVTPSGPGGYIAAHLFAVQAASGETAPVVLGMGGGINLL